MWVERTMPRKAPPASTTPRGESSVKSKDVTSSTGQSPSTVRKASTTSAVDALLRAAVRAAVRVKRPTRTFRSDTMGRASRPCGPSCRTRQPGLRRPCRPFQEPTSCPKPSAHEPCSGPSRTETRTPFWTKGDVCRFTDLHHVATFFVRRGQNGDSVAHVEGFVEVVRDEQDGQPSLRWRSMISCCSDVRINGSSALKGSSISNRSGSLTKARARPTRCFIPPTIHGERHRYDPPNQPSRASRMPVRIDPPGGALGLQDRTRRCRAPCGGEQSKVLKHHADFCSPNLTKSLRIHGRDVLAVQVDASKAGPNQSIDTPEQRGLPAAGEAHQHENFALLDVDVDVA